MLLLVYLSFLTYCWAEGSASLGKMVPREKKRKKKKKKTKKKVAYGLPTPLLMLMSLCPLCFNV